MFGHIDERVVLRIGPVHGVEVHAKDEVGFEHVVDATSAGVDFTRAIEHGFGKAFDGGFARGVAGRGNGAAFRGGRGEPLGFSLRKQIFRTVGGDGAGAVAHESHRCAESFEAGREQLRGVQREVAFLDG